VTVHLRGNGGSGAHPLRSPWSHDRHLGSP
jgi:hypothetical protein